MRYLVLSDIHANWEALEAVLADADGAYDRIVNCGDLVGYGPDPDRVVEFCRGNCDAVVRGNHDKAVAGLAGMEWFNNVAKRAALWSRAALKPVNLEYLRDLPRGPVEVAGFSLVHGAPSDEDEYLIGFEDARVAAETSLTGLSFFGHTHVQGGFFVHRNGIKPTAPDLVHIEETASYLINPGSVGQPRDRDPRAAYALFDTETREVVFRRTPYALETVYEKILRAGLPEVLAVRLFHGQ